MSSFCCTLILLCLFLKTALISDCFIQNNNILGTKRNLNKGKWSLFATRNKLKGARKFTRDRPKKTRPSAIYPSPTIYYGNVHNHFGAPPEYLAIPVEKTLNILRNGRLSELISMLKKGITGLELSELLSDKQFFNSLSEEVSAIKEISEYEACDVSADLHQYFESILKSPLEYENYVDKFYTIKKLQSYWEKRENMLYNLTFKKLFARLKNIAFKLNEAGTPLNEFVDPKLWHKYGVFKIASNCNMADNYLEKHKIALSFDIKSLYYRDVETNEIKSNFSKFYSELSSKSGVNYEGVGACLNEDVGSTNGDTATVPEEVNSEVTKENGTNLYANSQSSQENGLAPDEKGRLPRDLVERMVEDLTSLGVLDSKEPWSINLSRIEELQENFTSEQAQQAYAIRDFYLSLKYPDYKVESDPYILESYVNHEYRTKTYERDLLKKYKNWLLSGAPRDAFKPMNLKYQHLAIWHSLSKNQRRRLAQKYVKSITVPTVPVKG